MLEDRVTKVRINTHLLRVTHFRCMIEKYDIVSYAHIAWLGDIFIRSKHDTFFLQGCIAYPTLLVMGSIHQCIPLPAGQFCGTNLYTYILEDIYWLSCWLRRVRWVKHHKTGQFWCSAERAPFWLHDTTTNWTNKTISLRRAADRLCVYHYYGVWIVMKIVMSSSHGQSDGPDDELWAVRVK